MLKCQQISSNSIATMSGYDGYFHLLLMFANQEPVLLDILGQTKGEFIVTIHISFDPTPATANHSIHVKEVLGSFDHRKSTVSTINQPVKKPSPHHFVAAPSHSKIYTTIDRLVYSVYQQCEGVCFRTIYDSVIGCTKSDLQK